MLKINQSSFKNLWAIAIIALGFSNFVFNNLVNVNIHASCVGGISGSSNAAITSTCLIINGNVGALNMYAGDSSSNNDMCGVGETGTKDFIQDNGTTASVICNNSQRSVGLSNISVLSTRQNTSTIINDVLCEDLTGSTNNTYSVSATIGDLVNQGTGNSINLGTNPDGASVEIADDSDAPISTDAGKIYATYIPGAAIKVIAPESARTTADVDFTAGPKVTTVNSSTTIGVYSSTATTARRFDSDGNILKYRIPSFPNTGNYTATLTYTCSAI
jgi:hypothetical protein